MASELDKQDECDTACSGTEADLESVKKDMIGMQAASEMADWFKGKRQRSPTCSSARGDATIIPTRERGWSQNG